MKKTVILVVSTSVLLSTIIILISCGFFRPKCSVDFATKVSFTSITYSEDGQMFTNTYNLSSESLEILKTVFDGQRIYKDTGSHTGFENYLLTFTDGSETVYIRVADDGTNVMKHTKGYFAINDEQKENLYLIIYQYMY